VLPQEGMLPDRLLSFCLFPSFYGLPGAKRPASSDFSFPDLGFNRRIGGLAQTAQDQFSYALGSPHLDAAAIIVVAQPDIVVDDIQDGH